jgi:Fur family zinc uptake transcriptional regulator
MDDEAAPAFLPATEAVLDRAALLCQRRGVRLTALRRHVLGLVLEQAHPPGAYELLDALRPHHKGAAPPTVYRALEFLLEQGLVHKVERLSAFVGCVHGLEEAGAHVHAVQFLICSACRTVTELNDREIGEALVQAARGRGFALRGSTVEADGLCAACAAPP